MTPVKSMAWARAPLRATNIIAPSGSGECCSLFSEKQGQSFENSILKRFSDAE